MAQHSRHRTPRRHSTALAAVLCLGVSFGFGTPRAHAVSKDMIQLQTQIQQLQDAVARLQQSNDERMGVLKDLVQQTADSVNRMSIVVNGLQLKVQNQQDALSAKSDQVSGQIQSLNDSVDELKARLQRMEKMLADVQSSEQSTSAALANLPQGGGAATTAPAANPSSAPATDLQPTPQPLKPTAAVIAPLRTPPPAAGPSSADMYRAAYSDYMSGKYTVASSEFEDLIKAYPDDNLSGNAYFYLGEVATRANKPSSAITDYDRVLERYPDNAHIPAARLHKGEALLTSKRTDAGIVELRALIQRFPASPEAAQARSRLSALGVSSTARR